MRYRKLDENGDYSFGKGQDNFWINVPDAVAQAVETTLKLWLGEWFVDTSLGVPFLQGILGKHDKDLADRTIQDSISAIQGVLNIVDYSSTANADIRSLSAQATINTIYGPTAITIGNQNNA